jgi:tRNA threonylcarbamoyladenosine modification (KEOPS) complex Cgi121 subunit
MIVKEFNLADLNLKYFVGINQISFDLVKLLTKNKIKNENDALDYIFDVIDHIQDSFQESTIQIFSNQYVLDQNHIFQACYFVELAFFNKLNISNKKNIEFLLYLATNRQIKIGIGAFGIRYEDLESGELSYCIITHKNNLYEINKLILQNLVAEELELKLNHKSIDKFQKIKNFFEITDNQIKVVLNSYGIKTNNKDLTDYNLNDLNLALNDLICEKMTLLSLEKITTD